MLIHLSPRAYCPPFRQELSISLVDICFPELGLQLKEGIDVVARRPHKNQNFLVACSRHGMKAADGIFIETAEHLDCFTMIVRWELNAQIVLTHRISYEVLDDQFDAVTDSMALWVEHEFNGHKFSDRWPCGTARWSAARNQLCMTVFCDDGRMGRIVDQANENGLVVERNEVFRVRTVERERLAIDNPVSASELPRPSHAFGVESELVEGFV